MKLKKFLPYLFMSVLPFLAFAAVWEDGQMKPVKGWWEEGQRQPVADAYVWEDGQMVMVAGTTSTTTTTTTTTFATGVRNPLNYWEFDEDQDDLTNRLINTGTRGSLANYSGHGTNAGGANSLTWVAETGGFSAHLINDGGDYGYSGYFPVWEATQQYTIAAWAKYTDDDSRDSLVSKKGALNNSIDLLHPTTGNERLYGQTKDASNNQTAESGNDDFPVNSWHYIAVTFVSNATRIYIDGKFIAADDDPAISGPISGSTHDFAIGARNNKGTRNSWWNGSFDELAMWEVALLGSQLTNIYTQTKAAH